MKILFCTPLGGRTGSEMMLQYAIEKAGSQIDPILYSRKEGSFFKEKFSDKPYYFPKKGGDFLKNIWAGIFFRFTKKTVEQHQILQIHAKHKPDFWYLNTITLSDLAEVAIQNNIPYVVHVHELLGSYDEVGQHKFSTMMLSARNIICCSMIVKRKIEQMGFLHTSLVHECVDFEGVNPQKSVLEVRQSLGVTDQDFVWAVSGTMSMRKGYDLVPDVLAALPKNHVILWLGGARDTALQLYIEKRVKDEGLRFLYLGEQSGEYYNLLNAVDGFALLSREDPFPLVMIEAAYLQKPIVAFDSGGVSEFVLEKMGFVTDGLSVQQLTQRMIDIESNKSSLDPQKSKERAMEFSAINISKIWLENLSRQFK